VNYSRLVMFSFGFQQAFRRGLQPGDTLFFDKCLNSAQSVIKCVIESLAPSGYFRYAPDGHFVFASFASAFLLKLLRPEFSHLLSREQTNNMLGLIGKLIQVLASSEVSIDDRHTPKLYARFLASLLSKHQPQGSSSGRLLPRNPPEGQIPGSDPSAMQGQLASGSGSSTGVFHVTLQPGSSPHRSGSQRPLGHGHGTPMSDETIDSMGSVEATSTPHYEQDSMYAVGTGPLELSSSEALVPFGNGYGMSEEEMLATMHVIKNPVWWDNMMMPGFSWPDLTKNYPTYPYQTNTLGLNAVPQQMPLPS